MSRARMPVTIPEEIVRLAGDVPPGLFDEGFRRICERLDRYIGSLSVELAKQLELPSGRPLSPAGLTAERNWSASGELVIRWLLETLELYGAAESHPGGWRLLPPRATPPAAALRDAAVVSNPEVAPAYRVFELCAGNLGAVLRGEVSGEATLFSPTTLGLWFEYFSNANPLYAINNTLAAAAASLAAAAGSRVVEVGGGGGSAAEAVMAALGACGKPPASYHFTELHPAFLRRGARVAQAAAPAATEVTSARYDIDRPPAEQGMPEGSADLVVAVNTVHLARDLVGALERLRALLRPGGTLVLGELLRPAPTAAVHLELPFTLLEAYRTAPTGDGLRPRPGFLSPGGWRAALEAAGYTSVVLLPAAFARCSELYPGFYCGAISAKNAPA